MPAKRTRELLESELRAQVMNLTNIASGEKARHEDARDERDGLLALIRVAQRHGAFKGD